MYDMFIILMFFPIILVISYVITRFMMRIDYGPFNVVLLILRFVGVAIHELSHLIMCLIVGIRPKGISIRLRSEFTGRVDPNGEVRPDLHNGTFLQALLICFAPTIIPTWLFFWSLAIVFATDPIHPFIRIIAGFLCISNFFGATPSKPDFLIVGQWFKKNPKYSLYQLGLLFLSGLGVWVIVNYYYIMLPYDIVYYILVGIGYYVLKYSFRVITWVLNKLLLLHNPHRATFPRIKYGRFIRRRFKPSKPSKTGKREAPW